jgi:hypothetical protein
MSAIMSVRLNENKRKQLKLVSTIKKIPMTAIFEKLVDQYLKDNQSILNQYKISDNDHNLMRISEPSFEEWDNPEDEIYDNL